ncbi:hypothetical protein Tco_0149340 [Tanacetum coccineum]
MASESSSQQQPKQLIPTLNVHFKCEDGYIAFNNSIALLESKIPLYNLQHTIRSTLGSSGIWLRYLSLIFEHLLGDAYKNDNLKTINPHQITALSFKPSTSSEVPLTSHMLKVAKLSKQPEKYMIHPSGEVNADTTTNKSLSRTAVQHGAQPKALTNKKSGKKKIPSSAEPKTSNIVRESSSKKQVADTQPIKETVATADAITNTTMSLDSSKSAEEQENQSKHVDATKVQESIVEEEVRDYGITSMGNVSFKELLNQNENKEANKEDYESPFDTESEIKFVGK